MDRYLIACHAAERIINMVESAGFDLTDPSSIINYANFDSMPDGMRYGYGASRLVIWDDDYNDYVIKIALSERYEKFCQHEVEVYEAAVKEGFEDQFAWCACYTQPHGEGETYTPGIYVMEWAGCDEEAVYDSVWKHGYEEYCAERGLDSSNFDAADDYDSWNNGESESMILDYMESSMLPQKSYAFERFMDKWWVSDIHEANVGFRGDNMILVDYAGWNWQIYRNGCRAIVCDGYF